MIEEELPKAVMELIEGCMKGDRKAQRDLYRFYYSYALSVCMRYARDKDDALEILNDGFMKVFTHISRYDPSINFRLWLRRIMINTAIDAFRKAKKKNLEVEIDSMQIESSNHDVFSKLSAQDLLDLVQQLPTAYRTVFNLHSIDGFTHQEIADMLNIQVGTSKSNLFKAREQLKRMLKNLELNDKKNTFY